ncbi:MAG: circularly permuted type 2 ATP-grasp protein [Polyangiaceae bacterium]|nr:circularly permuted type 2 ATP-grasp protein [Polyangiaceae bacterium]
MDLDDYDLGGFYDELFADVGAARPWTRAVVERLRATPPEELRRRQAAAERALLDLGITFNVYGEERGTERIFPFDIVPRVVRASEWQTIERGLVQRVRALNLFLNDIYGDARIVADGVVPRDLLASATSYLAPCERLRPPKGVYCHVVGTDLVRDERGALYVLEDNLRCPSGVSYVLENRAVMKRTFPQVFQQARVRGVDEYPSKLLATLRGVAPRGAGEPNVVLLTPGAHNSAYYEHAFLAQQMGVELVEGRDLVVRDDRVWRRDTRGFTAVDVIYRRVDDTFLDPDAFRPDSMLGVRGLLGAFRAGNVAICNAPGNGVADDKVIYAFVPDMIRYYLSEDAILPNVPTYVCARERDLAYVVDHLAELVVKAANESGGYGMLVGPHATAAERDEFKDRIRANPRNYIAQPMLGLSRAPTLVDGKLEGRHLDLRPYVLYGGDDVWVLPGGLTRVALTRGSMVVNSSQGGGSKDTWVLADEEAERC